MTGVKSSQSLEHDPTSSDFNRPVTELLQRIESAAAEVRRSMGWHIFIHILGVVILTIAFVGMVYFVSFWLVPAASQQKALGNLSDVVKQLEGDFRKLQVIQYELEQEVVENSFADGTLFGPPLPLIVGKSRHHATEQSRLMGESFSALDRFLDNANELLSVPLPTQLAIAQVVPLGGIVLVLGFLGLRRMEGYDAEIGAARKELAATLQLGLNALQQQMQARFEEGYKRARDLAKDAAAQQFTEHREDIEALRSKFREQEQGLEEGVETVRTKIVATKEEVEKLIEGNPWLKEASAREWIDRIRAIQSVEEAHSVAEQFLQAVPPNSAAAKAALESVATDDGKPKLTGRSDAYHNCFVTALRPPVENPSLGKRIARAGLVEHPNNKDVVADLVQVCQLLGVERPVEEIDELRRSGAYWRSWRPVVFEADSLASDGSTEGLLKAAELLEEGVKHLPRDARVWRNLADVYRQLGDEGKTEDAFQRGLRACPYSQVLAYNFGEFLLSQGRASNAVEQLEKAMRFDYQEQYQADVSQGAVMLTAAQAYEANDQPEKARELYRRFLKGAASGHFRVESAHLFSYAKARLAFLDSGEGETEKAEVTPDAALEALESNCANLPKGVCIGILAQLSGPPIGKDRWLKALELVHAAHKLSDRELEMIRRGIEEKYV